MGFQQSLREFAIGCRGYQTKPYGGVGSLLFFRLWALQRYDLRLRACCVAGFSSVAPFHMGRVCGLGFRVWRAQASWTQEFLNPKPSSLGDNIPNSDIIQCW